jgi:hypothetical protein
VAAVALAAALGTGWVAPAAGAKPPAVVATVNGEQITGADVERALRAAPGLDRPRAVEALIAELLIAQDARRRKLDETYAYRRAVQRWREDKTVGLIGVDEQRRLAGGGKPVPYAQYYPRAGAAYGALSEKQRAELDAAVERRVTGLREAARVRIDADALRPYIGLTEIPEKLARQVVAVRAAWVTLTLEDLREEEPQNLSHAIQSAEDVLKMWQQLANELSARAAVERVAEEAGFYTVPAVREDEVAARRELLKSVAIDAYARERFSDDAVRQRVDRDVAAWSATFGLTAATARLQNATRLEAQQALAAWRDGGKAPAGAVGPVSLERVWKELTPEQKLVVLDLPLQGGAAPLRVGNGYVLARLEAGAPPQDGATLRAHAEAQLLPEITAELVAKLADGASIVRTGQ